MFDIIVPKTCAVSDFGYIVFFFFTDALGLGGESVQTVQLLLLLSLILLLLLLLLFSHPKASEFITLYCTCMLLTQTKHSQKLPFWLPSISWRSDCHQIWRDEPFTQSKIRGTLTKLIEPLAPLRPSPFPLPTMCHTQGPLGLNPS